MNWHKLGWVFKPTSEHEWSKSHAQVPFAFPIGEDKIRVFFSTRDASSRSSVSFVEVNANNPTEVLYVHDKPCYQAGKLGYFDDSGTMPSWFIEEDGKILLYYTGWNASKTASYRLGIGLAESTDGGLTFNRVYEGPLMDRSIYDPIWVGQPCVLKHEGIWKMWYLSCVKIEYIDNHPEPFYDVKYATSEDGINWNRTGDVCIGLDDFTDAVGRPSVIIEDGKYIMYYSYRNAKGYRSDKGASYRLGFAESEDGIHWTRRDAEIGIDKSAEGWDSEMITYPHAIKHQGKTMMFFNGNGFGASGFGVAIEE